MIEQEEIDRRILNIETLEITDNERIEFSCKFSVCSQNRGEKCALCLRKILKNYYIENFKSIKWVHPAKCYRIFTPLSYLPYHKVSDMTDADYLIWQDEILITYEN